MPTTAGPKATAGQDTSVEHNLGLVHACAHRFKGRGIEYDDLYQAGCMGLVKASAAFDADRGVMFSTYAVPVILGEIRRLFRDGGTVKVSRSLKELGLAAGRTRELLGSELGREATVGEVAQRMGRSPEDIAQALAATAPPLSLTEGEEEGSGQIDLPEESPEERLSDLLSLQQLLAALEERDRKLIFLRYYRGKTQTEVARCLGMTQVQVSRREKRILQAMREQMVG
ncbi:MAG: sigma-70 family RNA polymerase sigma factor [Angelakisella sp.]|nr:sigma-70 family RNA polymerase sigma factor [Angelakisella sp.]